MGLIIGLGQQSAIGYLYVSFEVQLFCDSRLFGVLDMNASKQWVGAPNCENLLI